MHVRTEKARLQLALKRQEHKEQKLEGAQAELQGVKVSTRHSAASSAECLVNHLQHNFFTRALEQAETCDVYYSQVSRGFNHRLFTRHRARCVYSLAKAIARLLHGMFAGDQVAHALNVHCVDDTSTRMRGSNKNDPTFVYTIMNSVQDLHVRKASDSGRDAACGNDTWTYASARLPTPWVVVENPDAAGIHSCFTHISALTADGVGQMWKLCGAPEDLLQNVQWSTFLFQGDALKANDAAFREELEALERQNKPRQLALRLRCGIHQIALARKPVVLHIPRLWSTVVRLSHLFEGLAFRKAFARSLAMQIQSNFAYMPLPEMPEESVTWKRRSQQLLDGFAFSFKGRGMQRRKLLMEVLEFLNGNLESATVFHFCVPGPTGKACCPSYDSALSKCVKLLIALLARGFPVPLLYRFKHYDQAVNFVTLGNALHGLLGRSLQCMDAARNSKQVEVVDRLMQDLDMDLAAEDPVAGADPAAFDEGLLDDDSFRAQNAKRKKLVQDEIARAGFQQDACIVRFVIRCMDAKIDNLMERSKELNHLTLIGQADSAWKDRLNQSASFFHEVVSGEFGWDIISHYVALLEDGLKPLADSGVDTSSPDKLTTIFQMILHVITDVWRRFVHDHSTPQYRLLSLCKSDLDGFVETWDCLQRTNAACSLCCDSGFTRKILAIYPHYLREASHDTQQSIFNTVIPILQDISQFAPTSSDMVEIKNGQVQSVNRRKNGFKAPLASREFSFLKSFVNAFELVSHWVEKRTLPPRSKISRMMVAVGRNQRLRAATWQRFHQMFPLQ